MSDLALWIFRASWQASCLAVAVFLLQGLLGSRLSARGRSVLWMIVIARLLMPPLPMVRWSYFHSRTVAAAAEMKAQAKPIELPKFSPANDLMPSHVRLRVDGNAGVNSKLTAMNLPTETQAKALVPAAVLPVISIPVTARKPPAAPLWPRIVRILPSVWLAGVILFVTRLLIASVRLSMAIRRMKPLDNPRLATIVRCAATEIRLHRIPPLLSADRFPGPAVAGWLWPKLLIPSSVATSFSDDDLRMMVMHELAHVRRRDVAFNWLFSLLTAVHWFNPVLWLAFRRVRADRELACDELVMSATRVDANRRYGHTLLRLADWLSHHNPAPRRATAGVLGILEDSNELKRRIVMISRFNPTALRWPCLAASLLALLLGTTALIDAAEPGAPADPGAVVGTTRKVTNPSTPQKSGEEAAADRLRQRRMEDLLKEKVKSAEDALKEQEHVTKLTAQRVEAAAASYIEKSRAEVELVKARLAVTDARIALAKAAEPSELKTYLKEKVAEAQELVKACEELAQIAAKMRQAGLQMDAADEKAARRVVDAKALLIDAKIAAELGADAADRASSGAFNPLTDPTNIPKSSDAQSLQRQVLAYKTAAAKAKLDTASEQVRWMELARSAPNPGAPGIPQETLDEAKAELADAQAAYAEAQLKERQAVAPAASTPPPASPVSEFQKDVEELAQLETQFNANHPTGDHSDVQTSQRNSEIARKALDYILRPSDADHPTNPVDELTDVQIGIIDQQMGKRLDALSQAQANLAKAKSLFSDNHPKVVGAQAEVQQAADAVSEYGRQWRSLVKKITADSRGTRRAQLQKQLAEAEQELQDAKGELDRFHQEMKKGSDPWSDDELKRNPAAQKFKKEIDELESQRAELIKNYGGKDPRVTEVAKQIEEKRKTYEDYTTAKRAQVMDTLNKSLEDKVKGKTRERDELQRELESLPH